MYVDTKSGRTPATTIEKKPLTRRKSITVGSEMPSWRDEVPAWSCGRTVGIRD
jgi:hypothetical protein